MSVFDENIITEEYLKSRGFKPYYSTDRCCDYYCRTILEKGESYLYLPTAFIYYYPKNSSMSIEKKQGDFWSESFYYNLTNTIDLEMIIHEFI